MSEKTLNNYVTLEDNVQLARVRHNEEVVAVIPRQEGKTASLQIYSGLADDKGVMDRNAIANALNIFKEQFPDAYANRTNHVNINNLFETPEGDSLQIELVKSEHSNLINNLLSGKASKEEKQAAVKLLELGKIRTAEKISPLGGVAKWMPQMYGIAAMNGTFSAFDFFISGSKDILDQHYDKVELLTQNWSLEDFKKAGVRFIQNSFARAGAYIGKGTTLMPGSIVNTGAYIAGANVMIDGGARVATGAQLGNGVKLGGGSGVEGILEPKGRLPTIIEDNVRVGANCEIAGLVEEGAVIASGVNMASGKKIFDLRTGAEVPSLYMKAGDQFVAMPHIPANRVAVGGSYNRGNFGVDCILLLEKDASQTTGADIPKNADLYL